MQIKITSFLKSHWSKLLSVFLFVILLGAYANIFALFDGNKYAPGATLDPECAPTDTNCTVAGNPWLTSSSGIYHEGNVNVGVDTASVSTSISGGSILTSSIVDSVNPNSLNMMPSIAVGNDGNPIIAYYLTEYSAPSYNFVPRAEASGNGTSLVLMFCLDTNCSSYDSVSVDTNFYTETDQKINMKVDSSDRVHLSYIADYNLNYSVCSAIDGCNHTGGSDIAEMNYYSHSTALDSDNNPYIIYSSYDPDTYNDSVSIAKQNDAGNGDSCYYYDENLDDYVLNPDWDCNVVAMEDSSNSFFLSEGGLGDFMYIDEEDGFPRFITNYRNSYGEEYITYNVCNDADCTAPTSTIVDLINSNDYPFRSDLSTSLDVNSQGIPYIAYIIAPTSSGGGPAAFNNNSLFNTIGFINKAEASTSDAINIFLAYLNVGNGSGCYRENPDWTCSQVTDIYDTNYMDGYQSLDLEIDDSDIPQISGVRYNVGNDEIVLDYIKCSNESCSSIETSSFESFASPAMYRYDYLLSQVSIDGSSKYFSYIDVSGENIVLVKLGEAEGVSFGSGSINNNLYTGGDLGISGNLFIDGSVATSGGLYLNNGVPDNTNNVLYNDGGDLYWGEINLINQDLSISSDLNYNTKVGTAALYYNTTGSYNTANGYQSLSSNTIGYDNTANGANSLFSNTTGYDNTANGAYSLHRNYTGYENTANGYQSLSSNTIGYDNTANGAYSLHRNDTGYENTANGSYSLFSNTIGYDNTANGFYSLYSNTTGYENTASGYQSLLLNTTGYRNTANGTQSLYSNTEGSNNMASGIYSLYMNTTGSNNIANGTSALYFNTIGNNNTANGFRSLNKSDDGSNNTALGYQSGAYIANGSTELVNVSNSVFIGADTKALIDGSDNEIVIGYNATGAGSNTAVIGNNSLSGVYFGSSTPSARLYAKGLTLSAGTATTGTAPLKLTSGTALTTTEAGAIEFHNSHLYFTATNGGIRYQLDQQPLSSNADYNTLGGTNAGLNLVSGAYFNTFLGYEAGKSAASGGTNAADYNTAVGSYSLFSNTTGHSNTANGYQSLYFNTTGYRNATNGYQSLYSNTIGYSNTANGYHSLYSNTTGSSNTATGYGSLYSNTTGYENIATGHYSLYSNTIGGKNTANGISSLSSNTAGNNNTANGYYALHGIGWPQSAGSLITGFSYVIKTTESTNFMVCGASDNNIGTFFTHNGTPCTGTGTANSVSNNNVAEGYESGRYISNGSTVLTASSSSIFLGSRTKALVDGSTNEIVIGYNTIGNGSNTTTIGTGNVLYVGGSSITGKVARFTNSAGYCDIDPLTASLVCSSDIFLKKNITTLDKETDLTLNKENIDFVLRKDIEIPDTILEKINLLTPVTYNWTTEEDGVNKHIGFIAQEVEQLFPDLVFTDKDRINPLTGEGLKSIAYSNLIPYTIKALQEMNLKVEGLNNFELDEEGNTIVNSFRDSIVAWLGNATNKITRIFTGEICLMEEGDEEPVCINASELRELKEVINDGDGAPMVPKVEDGDAEDVCPDDMDGIQSADDYELVEGVCTKIEVSVGGEGSVDKAVSSDPVAPLVPPAVVPGDDGVGDGDGTEVGGGEGAGEGEGDDPVDGSGAQG